MHQSISYTVLTKKYSSKNKVTNEKKKENVIRANAFLINLNAPETGYYYKRTRIASK